MSDAPQQMQEFVEDERAHGAGQHGQDAGAAHDQQKLASGRVQSGHYGSDTPSRQYSRRDKGDQAGDHCGGLRQRLQERRARTAEPAYSIVPIAAQ